MRRFSTLLLSIALVALIGGPLSGCDESPTSVNDFEIQPALELSRGQIAFIAGQNPPPQVSASYQGLNGPPTLESSVPELEVTLVEEEGTPENGSRTWSVAYTEFFEESTLELSLALTAQGGGQTIERNVGVQVNNPISITSTITSTFLLVEDYETDFVDGPENGAGVLPVIETAGGTTANVQSDAVSPDANGPDALAVTAAADAPVTLVREANAPGLDVLSFLVKPNPSTDFTLTVRLNEAVDGEVVSHELEVPVQAGEAWLQYNLAVGALFEDFNPVAARAGGNGPLQSVSFTTDQDVTYHLDDVTMGTAGGAALEINDFQETSFAYGTFAEIELGTSTNVAPEAAGPTARSMSWTEGGNFFGYNWNQGTLSNPGNSSVRLRVGQVSRNFVLYVFVEAVNDAGGYTFDGGNEVPISAGDGWQEISVPLGQLGSNPSALSDPGIRNVGFEIRRASSDGTTEPVSFLIDDIRLQGDS